MNEREIREHADAHRDDVDPDFAVPVAPKRLTQIIPTRFDPEDAVALRALAVAHGCTVSDLVRATVCGMVHPSGWRCAHVSVSSNPGAVTAVSAGCGCTMEPTFAAVTA